MCRLSSPAGGLRGSPGQPGDLPVRADPSPAHHQTRPGLLRLLEPGALHLAPAYPPGLAGPPGRGEARGGGGADER